MDTRILLNIDELEQSMLVYPLPKVICIEEGPIQAASTPITSEC